MSIEVQKLRIQSKPLRKVAKSNRCFAVVQDGRVVENPDHESGLFRGRKAAETFATKLRGE
jgi:hypothetical protein